uniref:Uncharacterized protein n=1 Tax=Oryza brachyantha TaxID=4533 RepID=J3MRA9_ORYBR
MEFQVSANFHTDGFMALLTKQMQLMQDMDHETFGQSISILKLFALANCKMKIPHGYSIILCCLVSFPGVSCLLFTSIMHMPVANVRCCKDWREFLMEKHRYCCDLIRGI